MKYAMAQFILGNFSSQGKRALGLSKRIPLFHSYVRILDTPIALHSLKRIFFHSKEKIIINIYQQIIVMQKEEGQGGECSPSSSKGKAIYGVSCPTTAQRINLTMDRSRADACWFGFEAIDIILG